MAPLGCRGAYGLWRIVRWYAATLAVAALLCFVPLAWVGCHALQQEVEVLSAASLQTPWHQSRLLADLQFLQEPAASDPAAVHQLTHEAAYAVAQMHGLQPALAHSAAVEFNTLRSRYDTRRSGHNVMAYAAGSHPVLASELVIVGADLDGPGSRQGLAALMEIARNYGLVGQRGFMPDRTIMVAAFSGHDEDYAGLRAYLRRPLWPAGSTHALVYLAPSDSTALAAALEPSGVTLHVMASNVSDSTALLQEVAVDAARIARAANELIQELATLE